MNRLANVRVTPSRTCTMSRPEHTTPPSACSDPADTRRWDERRHRTTRRRGTPAEHVMNTAPGVSVGPHEP
jgi:hypothetical protein